MTYLALGLFLLLVIAGLAYLLQSNGLQLVGDRQEVLVSWSLSDGYFKVWTDLTPKEIEQIPGVIRAAPDTTGAIHVDMDRRYPGQYLRRELLRMAKASDLDVWSDAVDDVLDKE